MAYTGCQSVTISAFSKTKSGRLTAPKDLEFSMPQEHAPIAAESQGSQNFPKSCFFGKQSVTPDKGGVIDLEEDTPLAFMKE
ncbi:hypothetical protein LINGRAHAP2_LOCUS14580 [Linum grandiflorum]